MNIFQTLLDAISLGSLYALVALGLGLLISVMRLINLAHGDFITLGAYALVVPGVDAASNMWMSGAPWFLIALLVCVAVVVVTLVSDRALFKPLRQASPGTLMIASFALSYFLQNAVMMAYGARPKGVDLWSGLNVPVTLLGLRSSVLQMTTIGVTAFLLVGLTLFLKYTPIGLQMRAAASDFKMARHLGINGNRVIATAFTISGVLAAVVALLFVSQTGTLSPSMGVSLALFGFIATVVGGMGSLLGAVVGGFLIGSVMTLLQALLPGDLRDFREALTFTLIVAVLVVRPKGLFPSSAMNERI